MFTCRIPGLYWFSASLSESYDITVEYVACYIKVNDANKVDLYTDPVQNDDGYTATGSFAVHLSVGDRIYVWGCYNKTEHIRDNDATYFSGMLVKPDI